MGNKVIVIMGVSGSGKTTIGLKLAAAAGYHFYDADDFHSQQSKDKMQAGQPLTDDDRWPWLDTIHQFIITNLPQQNIILACSALKEKYREVLTKGIAQQTSWILLKGNYNSISNRLQQRQHHYMPATLLQSQLDALEIPISCIEVDINLTPEQIVQEILEKILQ